MFTFLGNINDNVHHHSDSVLHEYRQNVSKGRYLWIQQVLTVDLVVNNYHYYPTKILRLKQAKRHLVATRLLSLHEIVTCMKLSVVLATK